MKKKFKFLTSVLTATMLIGVFLTGCGGEKAPSDISAPVESTENNVSTEKKVYTLNLTDYIEFYYVGTAEGQASIRAYMNCSDTAKKIAKYAIGLYSSDTITNTLEGDDNHNIPVVELVYTGDSEMFNNEIFYLKNGDVLNFDIVVNERGLRLLQTQVPGVEFVWEDSVEHTVSGLEAAIIEIDPFNDESCEFWLYFDGVSGSATLYDSNVVLNDRSSNGSACRNIKFEMDEMGHEGYWKNGDQIKIIITESDEFLANIGYRLTQREGIITIDWLPEN